ncbi:hypothetical protein [Veronia pacifica]|uniref:Phage tail protein n=1 Tax=Veronia pacifica TaxID=1080227 RepID=A0A1C3EBP2_9GAMM|nr:hypothetical protein [Veronia pacifica]ODA30620.1 hypothetical protein A8L45_19640 [Veronia pacifica]
MTTITDFTALFRAIKDELTARLPMVNSVSLFDPHSSPEPAIEVPAVLIEFSGASPGKPYTAGRLPWRCRFRLHCLVSASLPDAVLSASNLGATVAQIVGYRRVETDCGTIHSRQNWGQDGIHPVDIKRLTMRPGLFSDQTGAEVASVVIEFEQDIHFGDMLASPPDFLPETVVLRSHSQTGVDAWTR